MRQLQGVETADWETQYDIMTRLPATSTAIMALHLLETSSTPNEETLAKGRSTVDLCQVRDSIQAGAPEGCGCLGFGGWGRRYRPGADGRAILSWEVYCPCPDGEQAKQIYSDQVRQANSAATQKRIDRVLEMVGSEMHDWTLRSWVTAGQGRADLAKHMVEWLDTEFWLYLWGAAGVGKSGAAWPLLKEYINRGHSGAFVNVARLLEEVRSKYGNHNNMRSQEINPWSLIEHCEMLVLDDLGAQRNTDWATERLYALLDLRYQNKLRTIVTSNNDTGELRAKMSKFDDEMGERIVSRIVGRCGPDGEWVLKITGADRRVT